MNGTSLLQFLSNSLVFIGDCPKAMKIDEKLEKSETARLSLSVDQKHSKLFCHQPLLKRHKYWITLVMPSCQVRIRLFWGWSFTDIVLKLTKKNDRECWNKLGFKFLLLKNLSKILVFYDLNRTMKIKQLGFSIGLVKKVASSWKQFQCINIGMTKKVLKNRFSKIYK